MGGRESNPRLADSRFSNFNYLPVVPSSAHCSGVPNGSLRRFHAVCKRRVVEPAGVEPASGNGVSDGVYTLSRRRNLHVRFACDGLRKRVARLSPDRVWAAAEVSSPVHRRDRHGLVDASDSFVMARTPAMRAAPLGGERVTVNIRVGVYSADAVDIGCRIIPRRAAGPTTVPVENRIGP